MKEDLTSLHSIQVEDTLDIKKELAYYLFFWPWFLGFTAACLVGAFLYLRYEDRIYESTAQIQIKQGDSDPTSFLTGGVEGLMGFDKITVENDIAVMTSQYILAQVVQRLDLQTKVYTVGRINTTLLFNGSVPITILFKKPFKRQELEIIIANNTMRITSDTLSLRRSPHLNPLLIPIRNRSLSLGLSDRSFKMAFISFLARIGLTFIVDPFFG
jgi:hypothetical protein